MRIVSMVALALMMGASSAQAAPKVDGLRNGMPYGLARTLILRQGFRPEGTRLTNKSDLDRALQKWFIRRGYTEVDLCAAAGNGRCLTSFQRVRGKWVDALTVITSEPGVDGGPRVVGWR
jgi:hypothetical protein